MLIGFLLLQHIVSVKICISSYQSNCDNEYPEYDQYYSKTNSVYEITTGPIIVFLASDLQSLSFELSKFQVNNATFINNNFLEYGPHKFIITTSSHLFSDEGSFLKLINFSYDKYDYNLLQCQRDSGMPRIYHLETYNTSGTFLQQYGLNIHEYVGDLLIKGKGITYRFGATVDSMTYIIDDFSYIPSGSQSYINPKGDPTKFIIKNQNIQFLSFSKSSSSTIFQLGEKSFSSISSGDIIIELQQQNINSCLISINSADLFQTSIIVSTSTKIDLSLTLNGGGKCLLYDGNWDLSISGDTPINFSPISLNHAIKINSKQITFETITFETGSNSIFETTDDSIIIQEMILKNSNQITCSNKISVKTLSIEDSSNEIIGKFHVSKIKPPLSGGNLNLDGVTFTDELYYSLPLSDSLAELSTTEISTIPNNQIIIIEFYGIQTTSQSNYLIPNIPSKVLGLEKLFLKTGGSNPTFQLYYPPENILGFNSVYEIVSFSVLNNECKFHFSNTVISDNFELSLCLFSDSTKCPESSIHKGDTNWADEVTTSIFVLNLYIENDPGNLDFTSDNFYEKLNLNIYGKNKETQLSITLSQNTKSLSLTNIDATFISGSLNCPVSLVSSSIMGTVSTGSKSELTTDSEKPVQISFQKLNLNYPKSHSKIEIIEENQINIYYSPDSPSSYHYLSNAEIVLSSASDQNSINIFQQPNTLKLAKMEILDVGVIDNIVLDGPINYLSFEVKTVQSLTMELKNNAYFPISIDKMTSITVKLSNTDDLYFPKIDLSANRTVNINGNKDVQIIIGEGIITKNNIGFTIKSETLTKPVIIRKLTTTNNINRVVFDIDGSIQINTYIFDSSNSQLNNRELHIQSYDSKKQYFVNVCLSSAECHEVDDDLIINHNSEISKARAYINMPSTQYYSTVYFDAYNVGIKQVQTQQIYNLADLINVNVSIRGNIQFDINLNSSSIYHETPDAIIDRTCYIKTDGNSQCNIIVNDIQIDSTVEYEWLLFEDRRLGFQQLNGDIKYISYDEKSIVNFLSSSYMEKIPLKYKNGHPLEFKYTNYYGYSKYPVFFYGFSKENLDWITCTNAPQPDTMLYHTISVGVGGNGEQPYNLGPIDTLNYYCLDESSTITFKNISETFRGKYDFGKDVNFYGSEDTQIIIDEITLFMGHLVNVYFTTNGIKRPIIVNHLITDFKTSNRFSRAYITNENGGLNIKSCEFYESASRAYSLIVSGEEKYKDPWKIGVCISEDPSLCDDFGEFRLNYVDDTFEVLSQNIQYYWTSSSGAINPIISLKGKVLEIQNLYMERCYALDINNSIVNLQGDLTFLKGPIALMNAGLMGNATIDMSITIKSDGLQDCLIPFKKFEIYNEYLYNEISFDDSDVLVIHFNDYKNVKFGYSPETIFNIYPHSDLLEEIVISQTSSTSINYPSSLDLHLPTHSKFLFDGLQKCPPFLVHSLDTKETLILNITNSSYVPFDTKEWSNYIINFIGVSETFEIESIDVNDVNPSITHKPENKTYTFQFDSDYHDTQVHISSITMDKYYIYDYAAPIYFIGSKDMPAILIDKVYIKNQALNPTIETDGSILIGTLIYDDTNSQDIITLRMISPNNDHLDQAGVCKTNDFETCTKINIFDYKDDFIHSSSITTLSISFNYNNDISSNIIFRLIGLFKGVKQIQLHNSLQGLYIENVQALMSGEIDYTVECKNSEIIGEIIATDSSKLITDGAYSSSIEFPEIEVTFEDNLGIITFEDGRNISFEKLKSDSIFLSFKSGGKITVTSPNGQSELHMKRIGEVPSNFTLKGPIIETFYLSGFESRPQFLHPIFASYDTLNLFLSDGSSIPFSFVDYSNVKITFEDQNPTCFIELIDCTLGTRTYTFVNAENTDITINEIKFDESNNEMVFSTNSMNREITINMISVVDSKVEDNKPLINSDSSIRIKKIQAGISAQPSERFLDISQESNTFDAQVGICILNDDGQTNCENPFEWNTNPVSNDHRDMTSLLNIKLLLSRDDENINDFNLAIKGQNKYIGIIELKGIQSTVLNNVDVAFIGTIVSDVNATNSGIFGNGKVISNDITLISDGKKSSEVEFPINYITFSHSISEIIFDDVQKVVFNFYETNDEVYFCFSEDGIFEIFIPEKQEILTMTNHSETFPRNFTIKNIYPINKFHFSSFSNSADFVNVNIDFSNPLYIELENNSRCIFSYDQFNDVTIKFFEDYELYIVEELTLVDSRTLTFQESQNVQIVIEKMIIESSNEFLLNNDDSKYPILIETVILKENVKESCLISDKSLTIGHVEIISESNEYNMSIRSLSKEFPIGICLQNYEFYEKIKTPYFVEVSSLDASNEVSIDLSKNSNPISLFKIKGNVQEISQILIRTLNYLQLENINLEINGTIDFTINLKNSEVDGYSTTTDSAILISDAIYSCFIEFSNININFDFLISKISFNDNSLIHFTKQEDSKTIIFKSNENGKIEILPIEQQSQIEILNNSGIVPKEFIIGTNEITTFTFSSFDQNSPFIKVIIVPSKDYIINLINNGYSPISFDQFYFLTVNFNGNYPSYEIPRLSSSILKSLTITGENTQISISELLIEDDNELHFIVEKTSRNLIINNIILSSNSQSRIIIDSPTVVGNLKYGGNTINSNMKFEFNISSTIDLDSLAHIAVCFESENYKCPDFSVDEFNLAKNLNFEATSHHNRKSNLLEVEDNSFFISITKDNELISSIILQSPTIDIHQFKADNLKKLQLENIYAEISGVIPFEIELLSSYITGDCEVLETAVLHTDLFFDVDIRFPTINIILDSITIDQTFQDNFSVAFKFDEYDSVIKSLSYFPNSVINFTPQSRDQNSLTFIKIGQTPKSFNILTETINSYAFYGFNNISNFEMTTEFPKDKTIFIKLSDNSLCPLNFISNEDIHITFAGEYEQFVIESIESVIPKRIEFTGVTTKIVINNIIYSNENAIEIYTPDNFDDIEIPNLTLMKKSQRSILKSNGSFNIQKLTMQDEVQTLNEGTLEIISENDIYSTFIGLCLLNDIDLCPKQTSNTYKIQNTYKRLKDEEPAYIKILYKENEIDFNLDILGKNKTIQSIQIKKLGKLTLENTVVDIIGDITFCVNLTKSMIQGDATTSPSASLITDGKLSSAIPFPQIEINSETILNSIQFNDYSLLYDNTNIKYFETSKIIFNPINIQDSISISKEVNSIVPQFFIDSEQINKFYFSGFNEGNTYPINSSLNNDIEISIYLEKDCICPLYYGNFKKIIFNLGTGYETFTFEEIKTSDDKNITINKVSDSTNIIINSIKYHKSNEIEINVNDTSKPIELKSIVIQEINDNSEIKLKSNGKFYIQSIKFEDNKEDKGILSLIADIDDHNYIGICTESDSCHMKYNVIENDNKGDISVIGLEYFSPISQWKFLLEGQYQILNNFLLQNLTELKLENCEVQLNGTISFDVELSNSIIHAESVIVDSTASLKTDCKNSLQLPFMNIEASSDFNIESINFDENHNIQLSKSETNSPIHLEYGNQANILLSLPNTQNKLQISRNSNGKIPSTLLLNNSKIEELIFNGFEKSPTFIKGNLNDNVTIYLEDGYIPIVINFSNTQIINRNPEKEIILPDFEIQDNQVVSVPSNPLLIETINIQSSNNSLDIIASKTVSIDSIIFNNTNSIDSNSSLTIDSSNDIINIDICAKDNDNNCDLKTVDYNSFYSRAQKDTQDENWNMKIKFNAEQSESNIVINGSSILLKKLQLKPVNSISLNNILTDIRNTEVPNIKMNFSEPLNSYNFDSYTFSFDQAITFANVKHLLANILKFENNANLMINMDNDSLFSISTLDLTNYNNEEQPSYSNTNTNPEDLAPPTSLVHISDSIEDENTKTLFIQNPHLLEESSEIVINSNQKIELNNILLSSSSPDTHLIFKEVSINTINLNWFIGNRIPTVTLDYIPQDGNEFPKIPIAFLEQNKPLINVIVEPIGEFSPDAINLDDEIGTFIRNVAVPPDNISFPTLFSTNTEIVKLDFSLESFNIVCRYLITERIETTSIPSVYFWVFFGSIIGVFALIVCVIAPIVFFCKRGKTST